MFRSISCKNRDVNSALSCWLWWMDWTELHSARARPTAQLISSVNPRNAFEIRQQINNTRRKNKTRFRDNNTIYRACVCVYSVYSIKDIWFILMDLDEKKKNKLKRPNYDVYGRKFRPSPSPSRRLTMVFIDEKTFGKKAITVVLAVFGWLLKWLYFSVTSDL